MCLSFFSYLITEHPSVVVFAIFPLSQCVSFEYLHHSSPGYSNVCRIALHNLVVALPTAAILSPAGLVLWASHGHTMWASYPTALIMVCRNDQHVSTEQRVQFQSNVAARGFQLAARSLLIRLVFSPSELPLPRLACWDSVFVLYGAKLLLTAP